VRIAFLGTAGFAVPSLVASAAHTEVAAVITQPDRPGARGRPAPRPVADAARELGLTLWQPERVRAPEAVDALLRLDLDALVVAAYGQIIPQRLLDGVPLGGINVHSSLLPRWRGAAPVAAALLAGDELTGVSVMRMEASVDTGPVFATRSVEIGLDATTPVLTAELATLGGELLIEVLEAADRGLLDPQPQDERLATAAPRLSRSDTALEWAEWSAVQVDRRVRALNPWPGVIAELAGLRVHLLAGTPVDGGPGLTPGTIVGAQDESVDIATRDGSYRLDAIKPPGGRAMSAAAFLRGRPQR
jgi:methionyl-tRNA formyltransferase